MKHMNQYENYIRGEWGHEEEVDDVPMDADVEDEFAEKAFNLFAEIKNTLGVNKAIELFSKVKRS